jgi:hypothetical protein
VEECEAMLNQVLPYWTNHNPSSSLNSSGCIPVI